MDIYRGASMCQSIAMDTAAFPTVVWVDEQVTFVMDCPESLEALVVVFAWTDTGFALGNIRDRGWCTPSGRVEHGESHVDAAIRETREETGVELLAVNRIGCFRFSHANGHERFVPAYLGYAAEIGLPEGTDSSGAAIVNLQDLPARYYRWDDLLRAVFAFAERRSRTTSSTTEDEDENGYPPSNEAAIRPPGNDTDIQRP